MLKRLRERSLFIKYHGIVATRSSGSLTSLVLDLPSCKLRHSSHLTATLLINIDLHGTQHIMAMLQKASRTLARCFDPSITTSAITKSAQSTTNSFKPL